MEELTVSYDDAFLPSLSSSDVAVVLPALSALWKEFSRGRDILHFFPTLVVPLLSWLRRSSLSQPCGSLALLPPVPALLPFAFEDSFS